MESQAATILAIMAANRDITLAEIKAALAERTIPALWDAIGRLIDLVIPAEAANFFAAAGYDPT
jgi:hypothetical protein